MSEVNSYAEETQDPYAPRYVSVEGKTYLYKPSGDPNSGEDPAPIDVQRDLYSVNFYPDEGSLIPRAGRRTKDFDDTVYDFLDPIMNVVAMTPLAPLAAAYTAVKGLSGETLHASDYLRAIPGTVEGIDYAANQAGSTFTVPKTLGEWLEAGNVQGVGTLPQAVQDIGVTVAAGRAAGAGAVAFDDSTPLGNIIKIGGAIYEGVTTDSSGRSQEAETR